VGSILAPQGRPSASPSLLRSSWLVLRISAVAGPCALARHGVERVERGDRGRGADAKPAGPRGCAAAGLRRFDRLGIDQGG
jgi:hypothetical protein